MGRLLGRSFPSEIIFWLAFGVVLLPLGGFFWTNHALSSRLNTTISTGWTLKTSTGTLLEKQLTLPNDLRFISAAKELASWTYERLLPSGALNIATPVVVLGRIGDSDRVSLNGCLIGSTGFTADSSQDGWWWGALRAYEIPKHCVISNSPTQTLRVDVTQFGFAQKGIYGGPIGIGSRGDIERLVFLVEAFRFGVLAFYGLTLLAIGFYYLFVFVLLPGQRHHGIFACVAISTGLFELMVSSYPYRLSQDGMAALRLNFLSAAAVAVTFVWFLVTRWKFVSRYYLWTILIGSVVFLGFGLPQANLSAIYRFYMAWFPFFLVVFILAFIQLLRGWWRLRERDTWRYVLGCCVFIAATFFDAGVSVFLPDVPYMVPYGFVVLLAAAALTLAKESAAAFTRVEEAVTTRTQELAVANEELRSLDKMKEKFFANVSHDFKTPIAVAYANIEQAKGRATGEVAEGLAAAESALNKLSGMVVDVLDGLRAEAGELKLKWEIAHPGELLEAWAVPYRPLCERKGLELRIENAVGNIVTVPMDVARMERVLSNLLSNAIKFTSSGYVTVRFSTTAKDLLLQVTDSGPGIPEPERKRVFDRFYQGFNTSLRDHGGSGIGLSFVQEVVDLHHGRVWVDANPEGGSIFNVAIPVSQEVEITGEYHVDGSDVRVEPLKGSMDVPFPATEPPNVEPRRASVLVVDDNPEIAQAIFNSLRDEFNLYFARHGQDALGLLERVKVDGVLTDLMMPVMDGTEFLRRLRENPRFQGLPVVILSSKGEAEDVVAHLKLGAQDYVSKPFRKDVLVARLKAQIERRKLFERLLSADKMVTLGLLSAGVSHEIRNPLGRALNGVSGVGTILGELSELSKSGDSTNPEAFLALFHEREQRLTRGSALASRAIDQILKIVNAMRGFASGSQQRIEVHLAEAVDEAIALVAGKAKKQGVLLSVEKGEDLRILGYPTINQVFVNLLDNAVDACPPGQGQVVVRISRKSMGVGIAVIDNGIGIAPEVLPHIFDPFVTTKAPDKGTGLGLFIVKRIVELQHGGTVYVHSSVGKETVFEIELPLEAPPMDIEGVKPFHGFDLQLF
jgi:signal transduction histidine kinase